jgi:hypothetical protein
MIKSTPAQRAAARFFIRIGQAGRSPWKDEHTMPLFSLPMLMEAEGLLADDAKQLTVARPA